MIYIIFKIYNYRRCVPTSWSYAYCLVPFLCDNYSTVYLINIIIKITVINRRVHNFRKNIEKNRLLSACSLRPLYTIYDDITLRLKECVCIHNKRIVHTRDVMSTKNLQSEGPAMIVYNNIS
jgi:hypothetical protein